MNVVDPFDLGVALVDDAVEGHLAHHGEGRVQGAEGLHVGVGTDGLVAVQLNEAFAAVVLRYMQALDIPHDKINVCGGAIAMGHPLGATGAMILGTVLDELERSDKSTALATLCIGGGMGTATVIERV